MAFPANYLSFFFLLILFFSLLIHARDSQFFSKIPTTNNIHGENETQVVAMPNKDQEPNFIPENENGYGVYGDESGQLPPSTTNLETNNLPNTKSLPKNDNSMAYVTVPEETNFMKSDFTTDTNYYDKTVNNNDDNSNNYHQYYNTDGTYYDNDDDNNNQYYSGKTYDNDNNQNYYRSSSGTYNYNQYNKGHNDDNNNNNQLTTTNYPTNTNNYPYKNGGNGYYNNEEQSYATNYSHYNEDRVQQQDKSDTRFLENGKYFYDVNTEKYVMDTSYDHNSRKFRTSNNVHSNRNSYVNNEFNNYDNNNFVENGNEGEYKNAQDMP